ncbi:MAG: hypothetical protein ABW140_19135 [Candidatus Sedimenticola sp. 6PFRAG1]
MSTFCGQDQYPDGTPDDQLDNPRRLYHYEDNRFPGHLTGITDENGNRAATWSYDDQGRAISSEHGDGIDHHTVIYNADGSTTIINPLGKETTYHYEIIQGMPRVVRVEGAPTEHCEGANKSYSYDSSGFLISKTDWSGNTTTYTRSERGLELRRTEAAGTPEERTTITEWHPDFHKPIRVIEPGKTINFTYDEYGRLLTRQVQPSP